MFVPDPWTTPPPDNVQRPVSVQVNVHLPSDGDPADSAALMRTAQDIVNHYQTDIHRFMSALRRDISISGRAGGRSRLDLPGLETEWQINYGQERIRLDVFPAGGSHAEVDTDSNMDGYVAWIHADPGYPDLIGHPHGAPTSATPGPYNVFFNGYLIEENYQPKGPIGGYPVLFGRTALLCASFVGDKEKLNPLVLEKALRKPNLVIPPNGWGSYKQGDPKIFGYWIFDLPNQFSPFYNLAQQFNLPQAVANPQFDKGLYFRNSQPRKSPLVTSGINGFSATLSPASPGAEEVEIVEIFIGEFYDRGKYRVASQSWVYGVKPKRTVKVNDSPLIYAVAAVQGGFSVGGGMLFDLKPSYTSKTATGDDALYNPASPPATLYQGDGDLAGLNDDQLTAYHGWQAQVKSLLDAYQASIVTQLATIDAEIALAYPKYQRAYKLAILGRALLGDAQAFETYFPDYNSLYYDPSTMKHIDYGGVPIADNPVKLPIQTVVTTVTHHSPDYTTSTTAVTYGPTQRYYLDLTIDLGTLTVNLDDPLAVSIHDDYLVQPGSTYDNTTGQGTDIVTEISGAAYYEYPYAFLSSADDYIGPGQNSTLLAQINIIVPQDAGAYLDLVKHRNSVQNAIPPASPPMPILGDGLDNFDHSNITIDGTTWSYTQ